jgi:lipoate-protein ligase A
MIPLNVVECKNLFIFDQLKLEEHLLHEQKENYLLINYGSKQAIVLGISQKKEDFINFTYWKSHPVPIIKRFSGGGCVFVDEQTIFITWIFNQESFSFPLFPENIHAKIFSFYKEAFSLKNFNFKENDYVIDNQKCAGNAQYIKKDRFLHHTSFLWDYQKENMSYLLHPQKSPSYRQNRSHTDFLTILHKHFKDLDAFQSQFFQFLDQTFNYKKISIPLILKDSSSRKISSLLERE